MSNVLQFPLYRYPGIPTRLEVRVLTAAGAVAFTLPVTEAVSVPGLYLATMQGDAGAYRAVMVYDFGDVEGLPLSETDFFRWDGTKVSQALDVVASNVQVTVKPIVNVDGGFGPNDSITLATIAAHTTPLAAQLGLIPGITATHSPEAITVSSGPGSTSITDNEDGSFTVEATTP